MLLPFPISMLPCTYAITDSWTCKQNLLINKVATTDSSNILQLQKSDNKILNVKLQHMSNLNINHKR